MNRSPALLFLATVVVVAVTGRLGFWQLDRAAQKQGRQQAILERQDLAPLNTSELPTSAAAVEPLLWRTVSLDGRWVAQHTIFLDNRPLQGRPGFVVVTPLSLGDGTAVLVQRGWQPRDPADRTKVIDPPTTAAEQRILGRVALPPGRLYQFDAAAEGRIRQNMDIDAFAAETGLRLRPVSVLMLDPGISNNEVVTDGLVRDWPQPAADVHKNYGYAFQWFAVATLSLSLYVWFQIVRPWRNRRAAASAS